MDSFPLMVRCAKFRILTSVWQRLAHGRIERVQGNEWYLKGDQFDLGRITSGWSEKLSGGGNAFWFESKH